MQRILCDQCSKDFTDSDAVGGIIFGSYALCPKCVEDITPDIHKYNEEHLIRARAKEGQRFVDFVREYNSRADAYTYTAKIPMEDLTW